MKKVGIEQFKKLEKLKLPKKWFVKRAEITFEREGSFGKFQQVIYDSLNDVFYVQNNKCIVYPKDQKYLKEAIDVMNKVNRILTKP